MATNTARLSIVPFLQAYDPVTQRLTVNLLVAPVGDPRLPLTDGFVPAVVPGPAFIDAKLVLRANASGDPGVLPTLADVPASPGDLPLARAPDQKKIFDALADQFTITKPQATPERKPTLGVRKYLPSTYQTSFAFVAPKTQLAVTDDAYFCARKCPPSAIPTPSPPDDRISWGDAFAVLVRQPVVARAAGLIHTIVIDATPFAAGGFLFFSLASGSDYAAQAIASPDFIDLFATRVPKLLPNVARSVFTPVLFPVAADAVAAASLGSFDDVFAEALRFDDGFTRIVHCNQPTTVDPNVEADAAGAPPQTDVGLQIGWDDEDIAVSVNRALSPDEPGKPPLPVAPPGFSGWRVDARRTGDPGWTSLCAIRSDGFTLGAAIDPFEDELGVEIQASRLGDGMWLQPYHTRWRARSLVAPTTAETQLSGRRVTSEMPYEATGLGDLVLRYGQSYDIRVRMRDVSGGGPRLDDAPFHAGEAPVATWQMRRFVPLGQVKSVPAAADADGVPTGFAVRRPRIGWPEACYTGFPQAQAQLESLLAAALVPGGGASDVSLPDPDAGHLEITVLVRQPRFDDFADGDGYIEFYTAYRSFPALVAGAADAAAQLDIQWVDGARIDSSMASPSTLQSPGTGPLTLPTARDVRLVVRAVGRVDPGYFGNDRARFGQRLVLLDGVVKQPAVEPAILAPGPMAAVFMRMDAPVAAADSAIAASSDPTAIYLRRFAAAADLVEANGAVLAAPGQRAVFGVFGLAHAMAPDNGSFRMAATADLPEKWINVLRLTVERDWTWLGVREPAFVVHRTLVNRATGADLEPRCEIGTIPFPHVMNRQTALGPQDRDRSTLIVLDAFEPRLDGAGFPQETEVRYEVVARGLLAADAPVAMTNVLPITAPPVDLPKIISAGHAFSDYQVVGNYEQTSDRRRMLWLEFDAPPRDPRDLIFVRVLAQSPDPMLLAGSQPVADPPEYEKLVVDPELVRVVRPGQADDFAGLSAMQALIPAKTQPGSQAVHYLVPIPANLTPESPELLGFFTYEIRVGHGRAAPGQRFWSTATGRFGGAVLLEGVRHPAPVLPCLVMRSKQNGVVLSSDFAVAVHEGRRLTTIPPGTELWFVAYARVLQADGATNRNIQIGLRRARFARQPRRKIAATRLVGTAAWSKAELAAIMQSWGLPEETALGFLAVEVLPEPNAAFADPIGADLGQVRILRTSRLVDAGQVCCD